MRETMSRRGVKSLARASYRSRPPVTALERRSLLWSLRSGPVGGNRFVMRGRRGPFPEWELTAGASSGWSNSRPVPCCPGRRTWSWTSIRRPWPPAQRGWWPSARRLTSVRTIAFTGTSCGRATARPPGPSWSPTSTPVPAARTPASSRTSTARYSSPPTTAHMGTSCGRATAPRPEPSWSRT